MVEFLADGFEQKADADYGPRTALSFEDSERFVKTAKMYVLAARQVLGR